jgi:hypothetical protein
MAPVDKLVLPLRYILEMELAAGNEVVEIANEPGWPGNCELFIGLKRKFNKPYNLTAGTTFRVIDDYHYWYAEYNYNDYQQILVCRFEPPISGFEQFLARFGRTFSHKQAASPSVA